MRTATATTTPDLNALLARRTILDLDTADLDEALYAVQLRADSLGTDPAAQASRERLGRVRGAVELELARR